MKEEDLDVDHIREECRPLNSLEEVLCWKEKSDWHDKVKPIVQRNAYCCAGEEIIRAGHFGSPVSNYSRIKRSTVPKTLVCHDMKGGYLNDRYVNGIVAESSKDYVFSHWSIVDVFVYFSHHFVTIPPCMWINAAHKHGVKILGTLITEHKDGEEIWNKIFLDEGTIDKLANQLIKICHWYSFDGYLINIENKIDVVYLPLLTRFLINLKKGNLLVVWYDSVSLKNGELHWQNELNEHNKEAFGLCHGIFINYCWKEDNLLNTVHRAGSRLRDVYIGVDVFGRGCFGGGGYNCNKAAAVIRSYGLSMALFGVGWTREVESSSIEFSHAESQFWTNLWPHLYISGPCAFPFSTNFCIGYGCFNFEPGSTIDVFPSWFNLSIQDYQPSLGFARSTSVQNELTDKEAFHGGMYLFIKMPSIKSTSFYQQLLLLCDFRCKLSKPLILTICSKWPCNYKPYSLLLSVWHAAGSTDLEGRMNTLVIPVLKKNNECTVELGENYSLESYGKNSKDVTETVTILSCTEQSNGWYKNEYGLVLEGFIYSVSVAVQESVYIGLLSLEYSQH